MKQIIALGGGGFSMEPENSLLDKYILQQSMKKIRRFAFLQQQVEIQKITFLDFIISLKNRIVSLRTYPYLTHLQEI